MSLNKCIFTGRLTKDPEITVSKNDVKIARFSIASDYGYGENKKTSFPRMVAFGKSAEFIEKYVFKGDLVSIEAKFVSGSYDKEDGTKVYTNDFYIDQIERLEPKKDSDSAEKSNEPTPDFTKLEEDVPF